MHSGWCALGLSQEPEVSGHRLHRCQPRRNNRAIGLRRSHTNFRTKIQIADRKDEGFAQRQKLMVSELLIATLIETLE
jgi:hypothetical protein